MIWTAPQNWAHAASNPLDICGNLLRQIVQPKIIQPPTQLLTQLSTAQKQAPHTQATPLIRAAKAPEFPETWQEHIWGRKTIRYNGYQLNKRQYNGFREAAFAVIEITKDRPIIALGRSASPVAAFLSILNFDVRTLPMSDFRHRLNAPANPNAHTGEYTEADFAPLTPEQLEFLFNHFDQTLGEYLKNKTGKIYLMDLAVSGASLFAVQHHLVAYAKSRNLNVEFEAILFSQSYYTEAIEQMAEYFGSEFHEIYLDKNEFVDSAISSSLWDRFAEFGSYQFDRLVNNGGNNIKIVERQGRKVEIKISTGQPNPNHQRLRDAIHANILNDKDIMVRWKNPVAFDLEIDGITWDDASQTYRDEDGAIWILNTN